MLTWGCPKDAPVPPESPNYKGDPDYPCLDQAWKGVLGAAPYVGLILCCPLVGYLLRRFEAKRVLLLFLALNATATMVLSFMLTRYGLVISKLVIGMSQASIAIYAPVWVSIFAPARHRTLCYGAMQSAAAVGNLVGYGFCGFLAYGGVYFQWGFRGQASVLVGINALLWFVESNRYDTRTAQPSAGDPPGGEAPTAGGASAAGAKVEEASSPAAVAGSPRLQRRPSVVSAVSTFGGDGGAPCAARRLLREPLYVATLVVLASLYFVVTAIQYWITEYFTTAFARDKAEVTAVFSGVSASAPILGVVVGSAMTDRLGGLGSPQQVAKICRAACVCGLCAAVAGVCGGCIEPRPGTGSARFVSVVAAVWVLLFFGGAILPSVSEMNLESVPLEDRAAASSFSMMMTHIFGFALGVLVPGVVSGKFGLHVAMQVSLSCSCVGFVGMLVCYYIATRRVRSHANADSHGGSASVGGERV
uniref:Major facilitator superfamily (MFS) profile domain-containing protein n=1 Tax=Zooxanthella nutricula TaxID=1333877 RepID=A0A7S2IVD3_9DINO